MASHFSLITLFLLFNLVSSDIILEEGYTVTTVIDFHELKISPYSVLALPGSSDLLILDSSNSHLYTVSFPLSNESEVKRISSGKPKPGLWDGELGQARFNNPRSFALDAKGNVYVADRGNHVIRKITTSGTVTTIAGGNSKTIGNKDGPAQNATFSNDFELAIVAERCILLVVERGSQSVRQIDLKPADCTTSSQSGQIFGLGAVTIWTLGLGLSCLLGLFMGILLRPYIIPHAERLNPHQIQQDMDALPNQFGETSESRTSEKDSVSLLDSDDLSNVEGKTSQMFSGQLKDLISFDENLEPLDTPEFIFEQRDGNQKSSTVLPDCHGRIDTLILENVKGLAHEAEETTAPFKPGESRSHLFKRR